MSTSDTNKDIDYKQKNAGGKVAPCHADVTVTDAVGGINSEVLSNCQIQSVTDLCSHGVI